MEMEEFTQSFEQSQAPDGSLRKKLDGMFDRHNYVGVKNPLDKTFMWAVALEQNEIVGMAQTDGMNEQRMAESGSGTFLPGDAATRTNRITKVELEKGETKMLTGEAAYVIVPRLFSALVRQKYGTDKNGLARLKNPTTQRDLLKEIVVGPIINNVGEAMQTYVNKELQSKINGFTDVQTKPSTVAKATSDTAKATKA